MAVVGRWLPVLATDAIVNEHAKRKRGLRKKERKRERGREGGRQGGGNIDMDE